MLFRSVPVAYQHVREEPLAASAYNPAITPAMDAVILTGLAKDRDRRYPSAVAFSRDISAVVTGREPKLVDGAVPVGSDAEATTVLSPVDDATEAIPAITGAGVRSEEHTSELQSRGHLVCRLLLEKKKQNKPV